MFSRFRIGSIFAVAISVVVFATACGSEPPPASPTDNQSQSSDQNDESENDTDQNNDTQNNDIQNNDTQNNDTQNNNTQNNDTQNNDTRNNDTDPDCPDDQKYCDDSCTTVDFNDDHCGDCDQPCDGDQVCDDGECVDQTDNCQEEGCEGFYYCDLATGDCEPGCASDDQCGTNEECDLQSNDCVCDDDSTLVEDTCVIDEDQCNDQVCGSDEYCDLDAQSCEDGCYQDSQCGDSEQCDTTANECVCVPDKSNFQGECVDEDECNDQFCDDDQYCDLDAGTCEDGCYEHDQCGFGEYCESTTNSCEDGCYEDDQCGDAEYCSSANNCVCNPGNFELDGGCIAPQTVVDDDGDVGRYASLGVDGDDLHIAYRNDTDEQLEYAEWDGSEFDYETVDDDGDVGHFASLALETFGSPQIAYYDQTSSELRLAESSWSGFDTEEVTTDSSLQDDIALDLDGSEPHIAYYSQGSWDELYYVTRDDDGDWQWPEEIGEEGTTTDNSTDIVYDNGTAYLAFTNQNNFSYQGDDVTLTYQDGNDWEFERPDRDNSNPTGEAVELAISDDEIWMIYVGYYSLNIAIRPLDDPDDWGTGVIDSDTSVQDDISLQLDDDGRAHIAYRDGNDGSLEYARWDGSDWQLETVATDGDVGLYPSIAVDDGRAYIAHYDGDDGRLLLDIVSY